MQSERGDGEMRGDEYGGQFAWAGHAERVGGACEREDDDDAGDGMQVAQERGIVSRSVGERVDGVMCPLMVVFSLQVEAEVGGVREELGVDGEGGIGHVRGQRRGGPSALREVAVGEGEGERGLVLQDLRAGAGVERGLRPAGSVGSLGRKVSHEQKKKVSWCILKFQGGAQHGCKVIVARFSWRRRRAIVAASCAITCAVR